MSARFASLLVFAGFIACACSSSADVAVPSGTRATSWFLSTIG